LATCSPIEVGEEVVGGETLEIFARAEASAAFLLAPLPLVKQRELLVPDMHGPDVGHGVEPGGLFDIKPQGLQLGLEAFDGSSSAASLPGIKVWSVITIS
jgi:hypothetical protein